jgi:hypothetical protein
MAQLTQFVSVLLYSACSMWQMPEEGTWRHYLGHCIQDFEMTSLFVLFMHFYRKAYSKKKSDENLQKTSADSETASDTAAEEQESISSASSDDQS